MKTAMEKRETGLMRQIGYLSFVVVLLYGGKFTHICPLPSTLK